MSSPLPFNVLDTGLSTGDVVSPRPLSKDDLLRPDLNPIRGQGGYRTPTDSLGDHVSRKTALSFEGVRDLARQEFAEETDINLLVQRMGVPAMGTPPTYGEVDYDLDLLRAKEAVAHVHTALRRLPEHVLEKFGGPTGILIALEQGELTADDLKEPDPKPSPGDVPPPPKEAPPSA